LKVEDLMLLLLFPAFVILLQMIISLKTVKGGKMTDVFYSGAIIFAFALGSTFGAAFGWGFFGVALMFADFIRHLNESQQIDGNKSKNTV
jgi:uncharacterized membrane-anchored protein